MVKKVRNIVCVFYSKNTTEKFVKYLSSVVVSELAPNNDGILGLTLTLDLTYTSKQLLDFT